MSLCHVGESPSSAPFAVISPLPSISGGQKKENTQSDFQSRYCSISKGGQVERPRFCLLDTARQKRAAVQLRSCGEVCSSEGTPGESTERVK